MSPRGHAVFDASYDEKKSEKMYFVGVGSTIQLAMKNIIVTGAMNITKRSVSSTKATTEHRVHIIARTSSTTARYHISFPPLIFSKRTFQNFPPKFSSRVVQVGLGPLLKNFGEGRSYF